MQQIYSRLGIFLLIQFTLTACATVVKTPITGPVESESQLPFESDRLDEQVVPTSYNVELSLDPFCFQLLFPY